MRAQRFFGAALAASALGFAVTPGTAQAEDGWDWLVVPYIWAAGVDVDLKARDLEVEVNESFSDIVDKLDLAWQVHLEGAKGQFGFFGDYTYIRLGDKTSQEPFTLDTDLTQWMGELAGVYRPSAEFAGVQAFAGLRYVKVDMQAKIKSDIDLPIEPSPPSPSVRLDDSFTDFMIGLRYLGTFADNWFYSLRGDWAFGGSEGTWNLMGSIGWHFPRWEAGSLILGYRYLDMEFEDKKSGTRVNLDMTMNGPFLGLGIAF
jgi:hypothetical protein